MIPSITDEFMEGILAAAAERGVRSASWIMVRLPHEVAPLFREWLDTHFPDRAGKVMSIVQAVRGGKDYDAKFFTRMKPEGIWADLIRTRFRVACRKYGIGKAEIDLDCTQFRKPSRNGQLDLF